MSPELRDDLRSIASHVRQAMYEAEARGEPATCADMAVIKAIAGRAIAAIESAETRAAEAEAASAEAHESATREAIRFERAAADALAGIVADPCAGDVIDPYGFVVYILWGFTGEPVYVGQSTNFMARIGQHMRDPLKARSIARFTILRCETAEIMSATERRLIDEYQPSLNVLGIRPRESNFAQAQSV